MLKSAEGLERLSIPKPEGEGILTKDADRLLLTSHERTRLEGLISRSQEMAGKGPFKAQNPTDILKKEYERGLEEGGPGGGATVRAAVGIVRDWGLDIDAAVDARRKDHHHGALEDARAARMRADMVGKNVPEPPFKRGAPRRNPGTYNTAPAMLSSAPGSANNPFTKKRRPPWK